MHAPLPILKIIPGTFVFLWEKKTRFVRALLIPVTFIFFIETYPYFIDPEILLESISSNIFIVLMFVGSIIRYAAYVLIAITCHRLVLIGTTGIPEFGMVTWTRREWWFLAYLILLSCVYFLSMALNLMVHGLLNEFDVQIGGVQIIFAKGDGILLLMLLSAFPSAYILSRLSLLYPATAVDRDVDVEWAWAHSKNNGWRLTVIIVFLPFVFILLRIPLFMLDPIWMGGIIELLLRLILLAVEIVALSLSYKHLTENEIVEAKEEGATA
jgi:hypothetical protein